ncbi:MAG TPA: hypothetical protein VJS41_10860 [Stellaceae bacterium]|nr:hypothetical protein [Stellaceae bacterium]
MMKSACSIASPSCRATLRAAAPFLHRFAEPPNAIVHGVVDAQPESAAHRRLWLERRRRWCGRAAAQQLAERADHRCLPHLNRKHMQRDLLVVRALLGGKMFVDLADHEMHGRQRLDIAVSQMMHAPPGNLDFVVRDGVRRARHDGNVSAGWTCSDVRFWRLDDGNGSQALIHVLLHTLVFGVDLLW